MTMATSFDHIPVIDFSAAQSSDPEARQKLAEEVREVCLTIGFFYGAPLHLLYLSLAGV